MNNIKKILYLLFLGAVLLFAGCKPAAQINAHTVADLVSAEVVQSAEALNVRWALDGKSFWLQGLTRATLYNSKTYQEIASYEVGEYATLYSVSPDGKLVAYASDEPAIVLYDVLAQQEVVSIPQEVFVQQAAFSPDGKWLGIASSEEWQITIWDIASAGIIHKLTGFTTAAPVYSFQFGADGKTVLWIARATIQPMDIDTATLGPEISHEDFISASALSPDGALLATAAAGSVDGEFLPIITLWDAHSGEALAVFSNPDYFSSLNFSPDGSLLAAGSDGKVLFWDVVNSQFIGEIHTASGFVNSLQFAPDGTRLLTCTNEGTVQMWQVR